jgi:hypothetical protein
LILSDKAGESLWALDLERKNLSLDFAGGVTGEVHKTALGRAENLELVQLKKCDLSVTKMIVQTVIYVFQALYNTPPYCSKPSPRNSLP